MHAILQADLVEQGGGASLAILAVLVVPKRQHDVLDGREAGEQVELLEDEAELLPAQVGAGAVAQLASVGAVEHHLAVGWTEQKAEQVERRRLATSRATHD